jgi:hypothetical protein
MRRFKNGLPLAVSVLIASGGIGYGVHERLQAVELTGREQALTRTVGQLELQMVELTERFNQKDAVADQKDVDKVIPAPVKAPRARRIPPVKATAPDRKQDDLQWQRVEHLYADEQQKIASAEQEVKSAREALEDQLSSAKDELIDSIAKNHDELNALQKRGETNYNEFTLDKLKDFRQVGPVSLALQKVDTKHQRYNLELIVDQVKLEKKNVNLYEPIYLTLDNWSQPVVLVVNQIAKNEVRGYVSLPKYKKSDLVSDASVRSSLPESSR